MKLPSDLGNLKNLVWLDIDNTGLESIPESLYKLEYPEGITIQNNPFQAPPALKQLEFKFANQIYEKIKESNGLDFAMLKKKLDLPEEKIRSGLYHLENKKMIYEAGSNYKVRKKS